MHFYGNRTRDVDVFFASCRLCLQKLSNRNFFLIECNFSPSIVLLFRVPKWRRNLRNQTLDSMSIDQLRKLKVCSDHFKDHHYNCPEQRHLLHTRLVWNAEPTIIDCPNPPPSPTSKRKRPLDRSINSPSEPARTRRRLKLDEVSESPQSSTNIESPQRTSTPPVSDRKMNIMK